MDDFKIVRNTKKSAIMQNKVDAVFITTQLNIGVSPYGDQTTATLTDHMKDEIELDASDLRAAVEAFIDFNNIK